MVGQPITLDLNSPPTCRASVADDRASVLAKLGPDPRTGGKAKDVNAEVVSHKRIVVGRHLGGNPGNGASTGPTLGSVSQVGSDRFRRCVNLFRVGRSHKEI